VLEILNGLPKKLERDKTMNIKRAVFMAVLVVAIAALALPLAGLRAAASGSAAPTKGAATAPKPVAASASTATAAGQNQLAQDVQGDTSQSGTISAETLKALGIVRSKNPSKGSAKIGEKLQRKHKSGGDVTAQSGNPIVLDARSALSDALIIALGGRDNQFSEVALIADWDGREDCAVDHEQKVDDFSFAETEPDVELTRTAISEHTVANGFNENVYYYGDSVGNLWVGVDTNPGQPGGTGVGGGLTGSGPQVDLISQINIVALVNTGSAFTCGGPAAPVGPVNLIKPGGALVGGTDANTTCFPGVTSGDCLDDQVDVTGIAVNPVADLSDFGACGVVGEVVYVSVLDTEGCSRNSSNQPLRTRIFAFGFVDNGTGTGLTSVGAIQILRSKFSDIAGVAVDDDGSLYYQLVDLIQLTGGALFKATELCRTVTCTPVTAGAGSDVAAAATTTRIDRVITAIPDPPTLSSWLTPVIAGVL
jgi:hypothetical protein